MSKGRFVGAPGFILSGLISFFELILLKTKVVVVTILGQMGTDSPIAVMLFILAFLILAFQFNDYWYRGDRK